MKNNVQDTIIILLPRSLDFISVLRKKNENETDFCSTGRTAIYIYTQVYTYIHIYAYRAS